MTGLRQRAALKHPTLQQPRGSVVSPMLRQLPLWFASSSMLGGVVAAIRRDAFTAVVMGGWGLLLAVLAVGIAVSTMRH